MFRIWFERIVYVPKCGRIPSDWDTAVLRNSHALEYMSIVVMGSTVAHGCSALLLGLVEHLRIDGAAVVMTQAIGLMLVAVGAYYLWSFSVSLGLLTQCNGEEYRNEVHESGSRYARSFMLGVASSGAGVLALAVAVLLSAVL